MSVGGGLVLEPAEFFLVLVGACVESVGEGHDLGGDAGESAGVVAVLLHAGRVSVRRGGGRGKSRWLSRRRRR